MAAASAYQQNSVLKLRTLFISDVHLGSKAAKTDFLLDFLRHHEAETIILVGDIVDGWRLKRSWYWPQSCNDVVQKLLRKARKGTRIIYIPGNHDEFLREFPGVHFGGIEVAQRYLHKGADGRTYLVLHGDEFDVVVRNARVLAYLGDWAYDMAIAINIGLAAIRRRLDMPYWSFSSWAKLQVKHAVNFIGEFQKVVTEEARRHDAQGVICGHIHHAVIEDIGRHQVHQQRATGWRAAWIVRAFTTARWSSSPGTRCAATAPLDSERRGRGDARQAARTAGRLSDLRGTESREGV